MTSGGNPSQISSGSMAGHSGSKQSMANADARGSMTSIPQDWKQGQQAIQQIDDGVGIFKELFFHYYIVELESELQELKLTKSDVAEGAMSLSKMGHLNVFFRAMKIVGNALFGVFISFLIFFISMYFLPIPISALLMIFFLYLVIFQKAEIIYSLDQHRLGEKETGKFINKVRTIWHVFEFMSISIFIAVGILYLKDIDFISYANKLSSMQLTKPLSFLYHFIDSKISVLTIAKKLPEVITYLFGSLSIFVSIYTVGSIFFYNKYKNAVKENLFNLKKEYMHPADLAREKMGF